jgi:hypothetical protein
MSGRRKTVVKSGARGPEGIVFNPPAVIGEIRDERVVSGHGAGGRKMHRLIQDVFLREFGSRALIS